MSIGVRPFLERGIANASSHGVKLRKFYPGFSLLFMLSALLKFSAQQPLEERGISFELMKLQQAAVRFGLYELFFCDERVHFLYG